MWPAAFSKEKLKKFWRRQDQRRRGFLPRLNLYGALNRSLGAASRTCLNSVRDMKKKEEYEIFFVQALQVPWLTKS